MRPKFVHFIGYLSCLALAATAFSQEIPTGADEDIFSSAGFEAIYLDADNNVARIADGELRPDRFVFHAWLQDLEQGINLQTPRKPGQPTQEEQTEFAPSFSQNLVAGYVGFVADDGNTYPVAGAQVRWAFDRQYSDAQGSMLFGAADAASDVPGVDLLGIWSDQALTLTNNGGFTNQARFPVATDYPLHNATGLSTPDTSGATWVTLFSPDARARARLVAVASVNGVEIGKEVLIKNFAPSPELAIEKSVDQKTLNLGANGQGTVNFTVRITNTGGGDATNIVFEDLLTSGNKQAYNIVQGSVSEDNQGQQNQGQNRSQSQQQDEDNQDQQGQSQNQQNQQGFGDDGFSRTFSLPAGQSRTFTFQAQAEATANYCNTARITAFNSEFGPRQQDDLRAQACFEAIRPELGLLKDFVDENGESLGANVTVASGEQARLRVRVVNRGSAPAQNVTVADALTDGAAQPYNIVKLPEGVTQDGANGFSADLGTLEPEASRTFVFPVRAAQDGQYCDTATLSVDGQQRSQNRACLRVASPQLAIEKSNDATTVLPGTTYTSTVRVRNTGNAPARGVRISDTIAANEGGAVLAYESSQSGNASGTFDKASGVVAADATVNIPSGEAVVFTVTTRAPVDASVGRYCNIGRFESENAGQDEVQACVNVPAFAGLQNQFVDETDPVAAGATLSYNTTLLNEDRSNEAVENNTITYTYGAQGDGAGTFEIVSTRVSVNQSPLINRETGIIVSTPSSGTELSADRDYTLESGQNGSQTITVNRPLPPGAVIFVVHEVKIPQGGQAGNYNSSLRWTPVGVANGTQYDSTASEPTTVIAQ